MSVAQTADQLLQKLPKTYKKLTLTKLTKDFANATRVDEMSMKDLVDIFVKSKGMLLVKNVYAGVNAVGLDSRLLATSSFSDLNSQCLSMISERRYVLERILQPRQTRAL